MFIFVDSSIQSRYQVVKCETLDTVGKIKAYIEKKLGIAFSEQSLSFQCKVLKDDVKLEEYGIKENSTLSLNVKVKGGSERVIPTGKKGIGESKDEKKTKYKQMSNLESLTKDKELFLPEGYSSISDLQEMYQKKLQIKKDRSNWKLLTAYHDAVYSIALSADNQVLVAGLEEGTIEVFFVLKKQLYHEFDKVHNGPVIALAISKNKSFIVSGSADRSIKIFDVLSKHEIYHFDNVHTKRIKSVILSNDDKFIISASLDGGIKIFEVESRKEVNHLKDVHETPIASLTMCKNRRLIISGSRGGSIKVFDIDSNQELYHFKDAHPRSVKSVAISDDERFLVSASADKSIKIFDFHTRQELHHFKDVHEQAIKSVILSNYNSFIISASYDNSIKIFDINTKQEIFQFKDVHKSQSIVFPIALSINDGFVLFGSNDGSIKYFELQNKNEFDQVIESHKSSISSVALSSDGRLVVSGASDRSIKIFDIQAKVEVHGFENAHHYNVSSVAISNDNRLIVSGSFEKNVKIFDLQTKAELLSFKFAHKDLIKSVAISNNNRFIASCSYDKSIKIFDLHTKQEFHHFVDAHNNSIEAIAFSDDSQFIVSGSRDGSIKIFDIRLKQEVHHVKDANENSVGSLDVTNRFIVSGWEDGSVKIFDIQTKQDLHHFKNVHDHSILSISVSKDSKLIVCSAGKSIKVLDLQAKQELYYFKDIDPEYICSVAVSQDGKFITFGTNSGLIKILLIPNLEEAEIFYASKKIPYVLNLVEVANSLLLSPNTESFKQIIHCFEDFYITPFYWTLLHFVTIFQNLKIIQMFPSHADFKVPFLLDRFGKTPLHYLLSQENIHYPSTDIVLEYMIDYIEDKVNRDPYELELIFKSLSLIFPFILSKTNPKIRERYLKAAFMHSYATEELPLFGSAQTRHVFCQKSIVNPSIKTKIFKEGGDQIMFRSLMLYLNYNPYSNDMYNIVQTLLYLKNEEIFKSKLISQLLNYLWDASKYIMILIAVPFWIYMILLSIYFGIGTRMLAMEIIIVLLGVVLLAGEFIQMWSLRRQYSKALWNWLDLSQLLLTIAFFISKFAKDEEEDNALSSQWISSIIIMLGYLRWVSYLRLFKATRNLIQVIISIIYDMAGFIIILVFIIVGFSLIFLQFNRDNEYPIHLYSTYQVLYGNYDDSEAGLSQKLLIALILFLLNVVLLNLLISIMGDSYDKVQERRLLTDSVTRLEIIIEAMAYMRVFKRKENEDKGFLIYCLPEQDEEDSSSNNEWEGRINLIRKIMKQNEFKVEEVGKKIEGKSGKIDQKVKNIENKNDKIELKILKIEKNQEVMQKEVSQIKQLVENNHQEMLKIVNELIAKK